MAIERVQAIALRWPLASHQSETFLLSVRKRDCLKMQGMNAQCLIVKKTCKWPFSLQGSSADSICHHFAVAFPLFKRHLCILKGIMMVQIISMIMNAEKSAFITVQMCPVHSQPSGGYCDVVRSLHAPFGSLLQHH